jgi:hypothetical protein
VAENVAFSDSDLSIAAGVVTVSLSNKDLFWHTFTIESLGVHLAVPVGATRSATFAVEPGTYHFECRIPGHVDAGNDRYPYGFRLKSAGSFQATAMKSMQPAITWSCLRPTNVLFFDRKPGREQPWTRRVVGGRRQPAGTGGDRCRDRRGPGSRPRPVRRDRGDPWN